jgi:hypothetical protein
VSCREKDNSGSQKPFFRSWLYIYCILNTGGKDDGDLEGETEWRNRRSAWPVKWVIWTLVAAEFSNFLSQEEEENMDWMKDGKRSYWWLTTFSVGNLR